MAQELRPDVVLMDVRMPVMDGIEATRQITQTTESRVIILTTFDVDEYAFAGLRAGASAFMLKDAQPEELVRAVQVVNAGESMVAPRMTARLVEEFINNTSTSNYALYGIYKSRSESLTPRERDTVEAIATGLSNSEIAEKFFVSETTVKTHVRSILSKLDVRDRVQVVVFAYESGMVQPGNKSPHVLRNDF